jgi:RNA polymerase sigma-70 factor (ECF subfamily)
MFLTLNGSNREDATGTKHMAGLYSYAMILSRNHTVAEDLVQETYVRATGAAGRLRLDSNLKIWLFTILRNVWFTQLRRRRVRPQLIEIDGDEKTANLIVEASRNPHELYVTKVEHERVREAIQQLPAKLREVVLLREFEELSYQEIARILGCPVGTVMSRLGRARSTLRTILCEVLQDHAPTEAGPRR